MINKIKVLVVDDSAFMRKSLSMLIESDPAIEVIATAVDGLDALNKVKNLRPDIVTLDIEMPKMDGLTALKHIMKQSPLPVLMVSSLTKEGAEETLKALELGAVDFIPKASSFVSVAIADIKVDLIKKIKLFAREKKVVRQIHNFSKSLSNPISKSSVTKSKSLPPGKYNALAMGISTGGPISLQKIIPGLSSNLKVPVFVVQHMPPKFTASLAQRLNSLSSLEVKEAENNEVVRKGVVYIAKGGFHMKVKKVGVNIVIETSEMPKEQLHKPSVDVMFESVEKVYGKNILSVIMTGMGKDGLEGVKKIKAVGGHCIAQDENTCVVYGMPRAIVENGLADTVAPLEEIPAIINKAV
ncbi:MAG: chemotaxis response regulator protein-glutamate methylesterase [Melioribacteraceae bacterium]